MLTGGCHCGAVRYQISVTPDRHGLCHCMDCRKASGAPVVGWMLVPNDTVTIAGETREYASSEHGRRHFCPTCGTGLFYTNAQIFAGQLDIQSATLDDPNYLPLPVQVQVADRISWMSDLASLPTFDRYPEV
ncbi:GFA family protein [Brevundimonas kwangchunensis]|uniref:GFA family protein n=1 Tax=Brevundimonas kwangchunensis TaxID=322163 RepID=A0ABP3S4N2_9CAUL